MATSEGPSTLVQSLFGPQDHTAVLQAIQAHAKAISEAAGAHPAGTTRAEAILKAAAQLDAIDEKTRLTLKQLTAFLPALQRASPPPQAKSATAELAAKLEQARSIDEVEKAINALRAAKAHEAVPGFTMGLKSAAEALRDGAAAPAQTFGKRPEVVARACVRGAADGAIKGAAGTQGPLIGAIVGAIAASAEAALQG